MNELIQYTTASIGMRLGGLTLDSSDMVNLTLQPVDAATKKPVGEPMTFSSPTVQAIDGDTIVSVTLTQAQSASLPIGLVQMQVNWLTSSGMRGADNGEVYFEVRKNLYPQVMSRS